MTTSTAEAVPAAARATRTDIGTEKPTTRTRRTRGSRKGRCNALWTREHCSQLNTCSSALDLVPQIQSRVPGLSSAPNLTNQNSTLFRPTRAGLSESHGCC